jgi:hypothetical protein
MSLQWGRASLGMGGWTLVSPAVSNQRRGLEAAQCIGGGENDKYTQLGGFLGRWCCRRDVGRWHTTVHGLRRSGGVARSTIAGASSDGFTEPKQRKKWEGSRGPGAAR